MTSRDDRTTFTAARSSRRQTKPHGPQSLDRRPGALEKPQPPWASVEHEFHAFFQRLRAARERALLLDFDGTLAPRQRDRENVRMYPGVRSALVCLLLGSRCRIAIVSGRPAADLRRLVRLDGGVELWGSHGLERITRSGRWIGPAPSLPSARFLIRMSRALEALWPALLEKKPYGLAIHLLDEPPSVREAVKEFLERWAGAARDAGLDLVEFDDGLELRPAGIDKGTVVRSVFQEMGEETVVAYLGDDETDEDAFAALGARGLSVLVGARRRPTRARAWIRPPEGVVGFLIAWNDACFGAGPARA